MDVEDLFDGGAELGDDVVIKAQLRFRVRPPEHPVAQDIVDRIVAAYDEHLDLLSHEIDDVLRHPDLSSSDHALVLDLGSGIEKALKQPYTPGSRGGNWYRDARGHIRYGEKPVGRYQGTADPVTPVSRLQHYRPAPFRGMSGVDRDLTGFLMNNGAAHGFNPSQLRFLGAWYGADDKSGALLDAFLDCAGLTRADLAGDVAQLRFGSQQLTYEEAVFEFFAAQRALFMGDETETGSDGDDEWNHILNDEIKPVLDEVFSKYEALKSDQAFLDSYAADGARQRRRFYERARRCESATRGVAEQVTCGWDPEKQVSVVVAGLSALGLLAHRARVAARTHVRGHPRTEKAHLFDDRLLVDDAKSNPLLANGKLKKLPTSQLMLVYVAAELHRRWDQDSGSYSSEEQAEIGPGALGTAVLQVLGEKSESWRKAISMVRGHLDVLVGRVVAAMNDRDQKADPR